MCPEDTKTNTEKQQVLLARKIYSLLAPRSYSVIMFGALFCTLAVKFFHAWRCGLVKRYPSWILTDVAFLLSVEVMMVLVCFYKPSKLILRIVNVTAAVLCTWSVVNAGWLIRTGTQVLPRVLLPLVRAPLHAFHIIGVNLAKMPLAAFLLLGPSAIALAFFFSILINPQPPAYNRKRLFSRLALTIVIIVVSLLARFTPTRRDAARIPSSGLKSNCHIKAVASVIVPGYRRSAEPDRRMPFINQLKIDRKPQQINQNVVIVILEGVQYRYTSLSGEQSDLTPFLETLAKQGVAFSNARSTLSHTTKALFALLTGRFPSASQDIVETVPAVQPYAGIATILERESNYRTAFFQSAMGSFESRPGLIYNLGFDKFWARDYLDDPNSHLGYLGSDEFSMLKPIAEWIESDDRPFLLTILCSATHDPYEVPLWYDVPSKEPMVRYEQAIRYTDKFIEALDVELTRMQLSEETIFCVVGDHGEAFGEHGQLGHALIAFDETLRVPFCMRAPFQLEPGTKIDAPVSSVDLTPTLLGLLGFDVARARFDGNDVFGPIPERRRVYFFDWMQEGPAGFVQGGRKFVYNPTDKTAYFYNIDTDPLELVRVELTGPEAQNTADDITARRKSTMFRVSQQPSGRKMLFGRWLCRWTNVVSSTKYQDKK